MAQSRSIGIDHNKAYGVWSLLALSMTSRNAGDKTIPTTDMADRSKSDTSPAKAAGQTRFNIIRTMRGTGFGLRQPTTLINIISDIPHNPDLAKINAIFTPLFVSPLFPDLLPPSLDANTTPERQWFGCLLHWTKMLQQAADMPTFEDGRILSTEKAPQGPRQTLIALPYASDRPRIAIQALQWIIGNASHITSGITDDEHDMLVANAASMIEKMRPRAPGSNNTTPFLRAAHDLHIPSTNLSGTVYQFGWGARARWLDSTFTDRTPRIASMLARSKVEASRLLRTVGLPAPIHMVVPNLEAAERAAETLGYPVVVKPADQDGGVGVAAGLRNVESLRSAFARARKHSRRILVEKHFEGQDYRLHVQNGRLLAATLRSAGSITGDGKHNVRELLDTLNADPRRGSQGSSPLKTLELDEEALELLREQDLELHSVPPKGTHIPLRRGANITRGGTPLNVNDKVHPDNARLAVRAAATLRLDCAGVDLLIPDISVSWLKSGAAICEVNAQPRISRVVQPQLFGEILRMMLPRGGRIPIILVLGSAHADETARTIADIIRSTTPLATGIGLATSRELSIDGTNIGTRPQTVFETIHLFQTGPDAEMAIVTLPNYDLINTGLPCDRYDLLVLADSNIAHDAGPQSLMRLFGLIASNRRNPVIVNQDDPACLDLVRALPDNEKTISQGTAQALAEAALQHLRRTKTSAG
tara:strand:+ start:266055 stop:268166 length:2112 start_codon:yes stop_codon:yes gene_type:complete